MAILTDEVANDLKRKNEETKQQLLRGLGSLAQGGRRERGEGASSLADEMGKLYQTAAQNRQEAKAQEGQGQEKSAIEGGQEPARPNELKAGEPKEADRGDRQEPNQAKGRGEGSEHKPRHMRSDRDLDSQLAKASESAEHINEATRQVGREGRPGREAHVDRA